MKLFSNTSVYLIGQVETDPNATNWRKSIANWLGKLDPTIKVWDPLVKPAWMSRDARGYEIPFDKSIYNQEYDYSRYQRIYQANSEVRSVCKSLINNCVWAIARLQKTFTWGSIDELEIAIARKIPLFILFPDGPIGTYGLPGLVSGPSFVREYIFLEEEKLKKQIADIHLGISDLPERDPQKFIFTTYPNAAEL